ncbi:hypothetical protein C9374_010881 [Naegleria lovaniensis]|uniref:SHSP domain-containing protein n=1 Tax=Naegleria lovaniensis TaxID=51637 RepID=A0AA88GHN9_NAELO|nr:uncharacterized protein C9374_010881 [Naegleria lovaniensis]KAG2374311.1 hypothetical protein C9374_010881 [Naegleria lovaniensis]
MEVDLFLTCTQNSSSTQHKTPAMTITHTETSVILRFAVQGLLKRDLIIDMDDSHHILTVSGDIKTSDSIDHIGPFTKKIHLPKYIDTKGAKARLENDELEIVLPKIEHSEKSLTRRVQLDDE